MTLTLRHRLALQMMGLINDHYTVKQLAKLAGVSVRTLHYYDQIGLLIPSIRTDANYRLYGEVELLRLQQILFYRELGMPLQQICDILDDPDFNVLQSLEWHRKAMLQKQEQLSVLLSTIDKTILQLKGGNIMLSNEELYKGFTKEQAEQYRNEAVEKYGEDAVATSENSLKKLTKDQLAELATTREDISNKLRGLMHQPVESPEVQAQVKRHYDLTRTYWGTTREQDTQKDAYAGLADLYLADERFTTINGVHNPEFTRFLAAGMKYFASENL